MKFDTSTIDGFENMSDADKVTALLGVDLPGPVDTKNLVKKEDFDKVMSEASSYKKQLKEKMTAEETAAAEAKAAQEKLQNDYNALLKENTISKNVAKYIALGYDEKLAKSTAESVACRQAESRPYAQQPQTQRRWYKHRRRKRIHGICQAQRQGKSTGQ